jgi:hypothetical protein
MSFSIFVWKGSGSEFFLIEACLEEFEILSEFNMEKLK